jgi:peptidoglycan hydrolase-like protein with peptidoglycan-binding domain
MSSLKKIATTCITALVLLTSIPTSANAALSTDTKATLDRIIASLSSYGDITEVITYIYTGYVQNLTHESTGTTNNSVSAPTPTSLLCTYARGLAKNLDVGMNDPQVRTLQKYLNTLAKQNSAYKPVTVKNEGSAGFETTYYGVATQAAVTRWQTKNMMGADYTPGVLDEDTRAKMASTCENLTKGTIAVPSTSKTDLITPPVSRTDGQTSATESVIPTSLVFLKPILQFNKTSINMGESVSFSADLRNYGYGSDGCKMVKKFINQGTSDNNTIFSSNSGTYADTPRLTTEYYISCNVAGQTVESEHTTVVVDGVTGGAGAGAGSQTIRVQGANGETPWYTMSGGEYRYFFHVDANVSAGSSVYIYYGASNANCTNLSGRVSTTNSLTSTYIATIAASELQPGQTYHFCAAAVTSNGTVSAETPVGSFVAK